MDITKQFRDKRNTRAKASGLKRANTADRAYEQLPPRAVTTYTF